MKSLPASALVIARSPAFLAVVLFLGLAAFLHHQQKKFLGNSDLSAQLDKSGKLRPLSEVIETTRALKLVTVVKVSRVRTEMKDEKWRGTASATVEAPVRYVYGVDLSELKPERFQKTPLFDIYDIRIPKPTLVAVEVDGSHPVEEVIKVSGMRFESRAGQFLLGLARKAIYDQARNNVLAKADMDDIQLKTIEQIEGFIRAFVGRHSRIRVTIDEQ